MQIDQIVTISKVLWEDLDMLFEVWSSRTYGQNVRAVDWPTAEPARMSYTNAQTPEVKTKYDAVIAHLKK